MGNEHSKSKPHQRRFIHPAINDSTMGITTPHQRLNIQSDKITSMNDSKMGVTKPRRPLQKIKFRVLIIGRANAGKTSILQRVCDTTDSPITYHKTPDGKKKVGCSFHDLAGLVSSLPRWFNLTRP